VGNRRVELGASWVNVGAPLVSDLTEQDVADMVARAGGRIEATTVVTDTWRFRTMHWQRIGFTIVRDGAAA
jgi:hypothetical protein